MKLVKALRQSKNMPDITLEQHASLDKLINCRTLEELVELSEEELLEGYKTAVIMWDRHTPGNTTDAKVWLDDLNDLALSLMQIPNISNSEDYI